LDRFGGREKFNWFKQPEPLICAADNCATVASIVHDGAFYCGKHAPQPSEHLSVRGSRQQI
jgi:hypothetical protein